MNRGEKASRVSSITNPTKPVLVADSTLVSIISSQNFSVNFWPSDEYSVSCLNHLKDPLKDQNLKSLYKNLRHSGVKRYELVPKQDVAEVVVFDHGWCANFWDTKQESQDRNKEFADSGRRGLRCPAEAYVKETCRY